MEEAQAVGGLKRVSDAELGAVKKIVKDEATEKQCKNAELHPQVALRTMEWLHPRHLLHFAAVCSAWRKQAFEDPAACALLEEMAHFRVRMPKLYSFLTINPMCQAPGCRKPARAHGKNRVLEPLQLCKGHAAADLPRFTAPHFLPDYSPHLLPPAAMRQVKQLVRVRQPAPAGLLQLLVDAAGHQRGILLTDAQELFGMFPKTNIQDSAIPFILLSRVVDYRIPFDEGLKPSVYLDAAATFCYWLGDWDGSRDPAFKVKDGLDGLSPSGTFTIVMGMPSIDRLKPCYATAAAIAKLRELEFPPPVKIVVKC